MYDSAKLPKELAKKEVEQFLEKEVAVGRKYVNHARKSWFTLRGSVAGTSHLVLTGTAVEIRNRNFVPFKAGFDYSLYAENFDDGKTISRILFTASTALFNTNQIRILERYGKDAASALGGKKVTKDGDTFWQGDYNTIVQGSIQARGVFTLPQLAPKWSKDVSLDLFGDFGIGRYSAHDVGAGLLFTLAGQEEKKPVNVEVLFKFVDVSRKLLPGKEALDRLQIGLSLAMPIDGMLNKL